LFLHEFDVPSAASAEEPTGTDTRKSHAQQFLAGVPTAGTEFPPSPRAGQLWVDWTNGFVWSYDGFEWHTVTGVQVVGSPTEINAPALNQIVYAANGNTLFQWNGTAWRQFSLKEPYFHGYQATAQTGLVTATYTALTLNAEVIDSHGWHSVVTSEQPTRYTPKIAGYYRCSGQASFPNTITGGMLAEFRRNGVAVAGNKYGSAIASNQAFAGNSVRAEATIFCNGTTDYIELWAAHNAGSTQPTFVGGNAGTYAIIEFAYPA
jgi:hypothetical protein